MLGDMPHNHHGHPPTPVALGLGGNIGDTYQIFVRAVAAIAADRRCHHPVCSSVYQTPAFGPPQDDYLNAVVVLAWADTPQALLQLCRQLELQAKRVRIEERWGPRTLDCDILLFGEACITEPELVIPHYGIQERASVLVPLAEVAPGWLVPERGFEDQTHPAEKVGTLLRALPAQERDAVRWRESQHFVRAGSENAAWRRPSPAARRRADSTHRLLPRPRIEPGDRR